VASGEDEQGLLPLETYLLFLALLLGLFLDSA